MLTIFFSHSLFYFLRHGLSLTLNLIDQLDWAGQQVPEIPSTFPSLGFHPCISVASFYMVLRTELSSSYFVASVLLTEASRLHTFYWPVVELIDSSAISNLLIKSQLIKSVCMVIFSSRISFGFYL